MSIPVKVALRKSKDGRTLYANYGEFRWIVPTTRSKKSEEDSDAQFYINPINGAGGLRVCGLHKVKDETGIYLLGTGEAESPEWGIYVKGCKIEVRPERESFSSMSEYFLIIYPREGSTFTKLFEEGA